MLRTLLELLVVVAASALAVTPLTRRGVVAAGAAAASSVLGARAAHADKAPKKPRFFETQGGVKYFDIDSSNTCSPFSPCTPSAGDLVKLEYKAYLSNGKMFDSSSGPGRKPLAATFKADPPQLLPGWEEALETMKMGQTRVIQVPPELAYGDKGVSVTNAAGDTEFLVPPREKLQFELTLKQVGVPPP